eukprot:3226807-Amphidinium_carterae.2
MFSICFLGWLKALHTLPLKVLAELTRFGKGGDHGQWFSTMPLQAYSITQSKQEKRDIDR